MDYLCSRLDDLTKKLEGLQVLSGETSPSRLTLLSHNQLGLLHTAAEGASLHVLSLAPRLEDFDTKSQTVIKVPNDAHSIVPARDMVAVVGTRSVTVVDWPLSASPTVRHVCDVILANRPALQVLQAAWAPHAPGFLLVLTSDATLRLFDVISPATATIERFRLHVGQGSVPPVSFAFGRGCLWASLSVFILMTDGSIFVAAPIAPLGARLPYALWSGMRQSIQSDMSRNTGENMPDPQSNQQADLRLRFLDHVFEKSPTGDMVAVREFKPAALQVQGPLSIEHDDVINQDDKGTQRCTSLTILDYGVNVPPILLRASENGQVSVLIALELPEPRWKIDTSFSLLTAPESIGEQDVNDPTFSSSLLCFERILFDDKRVTFVPLGGPHADIIFGVSSHTVYSLRLSFLSNLSDAIALGRSAPSCVTRLLSTVPLSGKASGEADRHPSCIIGLAPHFVRTIGPIAIALTSDGNLHATAPIRWMTHVDSTSPLSVLPSPPSGSQRISESSPSRDEVYACSEVGKEVAELIKFVCCTQERIGGRVTKGTLGNAFAATDSFRIFDELERRVSLHVGNSDSAGILDGFGNLSEALSTWVRALHDRTAITKNQSVKLAQLWTSVASCEMRTTRQLSRVQEISLLLEERVRALLMAVENSWFELSPAEIIHGERLRERSRRMLFLRSRIEELRIAVEALRKNYQTLISNSLSGAFSSAMDLKSDHSWSSSPLNRFASLKALRSPQRNDRGFLTHKQTRRTSSSSSSMTLNPVDLQRIRAALEKHSAQIATAMKIESSLRKKMTLS